MRLTITGRTPSKKNSINIVCTGRFPRKFPSNDYLKWHKTAKQEVLAQAAILKAAVTPIAEIAITIFATDRRAADLTNKAESVMDLLVDCGVIADDNWFVVPRVVLLFGGVDKGNPRAEVLIQ